MKFTIFTALFITTWSLPAWECGLKYDQKLVIVCAGVSLPAWECGLKYVTIARGQGKQYVTPCVGVWIEIIPQLLVMTSLESLPAWECGLKYIARL